MKGQEVVNLMDKVDEILDSVSLVHYKNLRHDLKKYKRVHVNNSFVILFFGHDNVVYFVDYEHHDKVYNFDKKQLKKYANLEFE